MSRATEWIKGHKPHTAAMIVAAAAAICLVAAVACGAFAPTTQQEEPGAARLTINVTADAGWDENSTPAIAHIEGGEVDFYHAISPDVEGGRGTSTIGLSEGDYTVSLISPLNSDGTAYELYETSEEQRISLEADGELSIDFAMKLVAAGDVTDEQIRDIVSQTKAAVQNGDETLKGVAGRAVLERLEQNAAANPNASDEIKAEAARAEDEVDVDGEPANPTPPSSSSSGGGLDAVVSEGGSSSSGEAASGGNAGSGQAPAHTHTWKDHTATRQVWVSNMVTVPDYEAQTIQGAQLYTQHSDGQWYSDGAVYWFENGFTINDLAAIIRDKMVNEGYIGNYVNRTKTEQVQVGSHQEDQGWYETETYVDYQYCDCGERK